MKIFALFLRLVWVVRFLYLVVFVGVYSHFGKEGLGPKNACVVLHAPTMEPSFLSLPCLSLLELPLTFPSRVPASSNAFITTLCFPLSIFWQTFQI